MWGKTTNDYTVMNCFKHQKLFSQTSWCIFVHRLSTKITTHSHWRQFKRSCEIV